MEQYQGGFFALGLTRTPDIRLTALGFFCIINRGFTVLITTAMILHVWWFCSLALLEEPDIIMNKKGQFSIIAALFVVVILVSSVMVTYSAIHYSPAQAQPQIMSAVDETNLALKQVLGFTVGYFGSVLQVTGNSSYAYAQSSNYLNSGLENIVDMNPEWGTSFNNTSLSLQH